MKRQCGRNNVFRTLSKLVITVTVEILHINDRLPNVFEKKMRKYTQSHPDGISSGDSMYFQETGKETRNVHSDRCIFELSHYQLPYRNMPQSFSRNVFKTTARISENNIRWHEHCLRNKYKDDVVFKRHASEQVKTLLETGIKKVKPADIYTSMYTLLTQQPCVGTPEV